MASYVWSIAFFVLLIAASEAVKQPIQTFRPYNVAHRGANGELPEETAAAYMRAIEEGADFIETDILATKDGHLICFHDVTLDATTDVASRKEFAGRNRTYVVEYTTISGFFVVDFTLDEIKSLGAKQRFAFRDQSYNGNFSVITFEEYIAIALDAPRVVGIYPEIKSPVHINEHVKWAGGKKFEDVFVDTLKKYGYKGKYLSESWMEKPLYIQSFAPSSLFYVYNLTDSPLVFLIDDVTIRTQDTNQSYAEITSDSYLSFISKYCVGIGPWKDTLVRPVNNRLTAPTDLVAKAHAHGLTVHPYTFRNENQYLHWDFHQDPYMEYYYWIYVIGVDGVFTDFTGSFQRFMDYTFPHPKGNETASDVLAKIEGLISSFKHA